MRIILIQSENEIRDKLIFLLESAFGATVDAFAGLENLEKYKGEKVDVFILDSKDAELSGLLPHALRIAPDAPHIEIIENGTVESVTKKLARIEQRNLVTKLAEIIDGWIDQGVIRETGYPESRCRIRTKLLLSVSPLRGDIYIRLSESKFVKIFRQGDVFDRDDLEKYAEKKGVEYLYIKRDECALFADKYREDIQKMLKDPLLSVGQVMQSSEMVHETVQNLALCVGFTKEVQELVKAQVQLTMKMIAKNARLVELFSRLKGQQGRYISSHSHLCAYIGCMIAAQMKWGSEQTFLKLNLACFLHDVTLENHELAAETTLDEVQRNVKYTQKDVKAFQEHPRIAAGLVSRYSEVPPDVDTIVAQHHELPDGRGFPQGLNHTRIAPLTTIFIIAHDMSQWIMSHDFEFDLNAFLARQGDKYIGSQFKKIIAALQQIEELKKPVSPPKAA